MSSLRLAAAPFLELDASDDFSVVNAAGHRGIALLSTPLGVGRDPIFVSGFRPRLVMGA
jgi:hypothetical protein